MARRRTKSAMDINQQTLRIVDELANRAWQSPDRDRQIARMERARDINTRYTNNISRALGERDGWISNSNYEVQVPRRAYMGLNAG